MRLLLRLGATPLVALASLIFLMLIFGMQGPMFNPPYLLLILNGVFLTGVNLFVAGISAKSYLNFGYRNILFLGSSLVISGLVSIISGWATNFDVNFAVTVFNVGMLVFAVLQLASVILTPNTFSVEVAGLKRKLLFAYSLAIAFVVVLSAISWLNWMPMFFAPTGTTPIRQLVLWSAILLLLISCILFLWRYSQSKSESLYWYALGLGSFAIGLFGVAAGSYVGNYIGWAGRLAQYIGGIYFLIAILRLNVGPKLDSTLSGQWAEAFRTDRRQFLALFSSLLNGFAYHRIIIDKTGKPVDYIFLEVNDAFERITGLSRNSVLGKRVTEALPGIEKDPADWIGRYGQVALTGKPMMFENYAIALDKWFSISAYSPKKGYFVALFEDITERKKAEEALRESEERFKAISESAFEGIVIHIEGKIVEMNQRFALMYGYDRLELIGKSLLDLSIPESHERIMQRITSGSEDPYEITALRKDGSTFIAEIRGKNATYKGVACRAGSIRDITERKKLQQKLEEYTKNLENLVEERTRQLQDKERLAAIGQTAGMVGHDIRNPLQAIVSSLFLIQTELDELPDSKQKKFSLEEVASIREQIDYVNKIIADLQDYARPLKAARVEVDIKSLVTSSLSAVTVPFNIETLTSFEESLPKLQTDPMLLKRILVNLTINAIQAMPEGGELTINAYTDKKENMLAISVQDTGVGIPEEIKSKLFTPLFTTKSKGQGFGLVVVKRLVEVLGGTITFESQEGKGAKFIVKLPF